MVVEAPHTFIEKDLVHKLQELRDAFVMIVLYIVFLPELDEVQDVGYHPLVKP